MATVSTISSSSSKFSFEPSPEQCVSIAATTDDLKDLSGISSKGNVVYVQHRSDSGEIEHIPLCIRIPTGTIAKWSNKHAEYGNSIQIEVSETFGEYLNDLVLRWSEQVMEANAGLLLGTSDVKLPAYIPPDVRYNPTIRYKLKGGESIEAGDRLDGAILKAHMWYYKERKQVGMYFKLMGRKLVVLK